MAIRLDKKNSYKESVNIKDIYSRNSSLIGRFLLRNNNIFSKVSDIYEGIIRLGGNITISTVSKVLKALKEELIISKSSNEIKLIQPSKLLLLLKENYKLPNIISQYKLKLPPEREKAKLILNDLIKNNWIWSGDSCAEFYASTTPTVQFSVYSKLKPDENKILPFIDDKFYNYTLNIIAPGNSYIFFNSLNNKASKIQTCLELSKLDKREKEIAADIEKDILDELTK